MGTKTRWLIALFTASAALLIASAATVGSFREQDRGQAPAHRYTDESPPPEGMVFRAAERSQGKSTAAGTGEWKGRAGAAEWNEGTAVEWEVDLDNEGSYRLAVGYYPLEGNGQDIEFRLWVDGVPQSANNEPFKLNRAWRDEALQVKQLRGNDVRPRQVEEPLWLDTPVLQAAQGNPLVLRLGKGLHRIRLENIRERAMLDYIRLYPDEQPPTYAEYRMAATGAGTSAKAAGTAARTVVQAEHAYLKSSSGILPTMDRTSPMTFPYHPVKMRLNTIGGSNWDTPGQWISWKLDIPEDGWYKLGLRYHQSKVKGSFVSRKVYVDGRIPFAEWEQIRFPYALNWQIQELGEQDDTGRQEPHLIYLNRGTHYIKLEVTLGELAPSLRNVGKLVSELTQLYRRIVMVTGVRPDPYRDYELDRSIPGLIGELMNIQGRLGMEAEQLEQLTGGGNPGSRSLRLLANQTASFIDRPDTLPKRLDSFKTNMTGLADWMLTVSSQPLEVDYLYAAAPASSKPAAEASLLRKSVHELRAFAGSFLENYNAVGEAAGTADRSIEVWTGLGRDQAYVVKRLIEDSFTPETGIDVRFNLVESSLVTAVMAGEGPDVSLLTSRGDTMNLAIRGALEPLDGMEGFGRLPEQYMPSAFRPYMYNGRTYAIPEDQEFYMMFYRKDILKELGLEPPGTWEELLKLAPELFNHNMQIGLPYENLDAFQLLKRGIGTLNLFPTLLMQNGTGLYNRELTGTRLEEPQAYEAFKMWTDFYSLFDYPLYKDDFNRFRTGEMPIVIASYRLFNNLTKAAPEITGTWAFQPIPGTRQADGTVNRATGATGTASIMLRKAPDKDAAWTFLKWWNRPDTQSRFAKELENELGVLGRRTPANLKAFEAANWNREQQAALLEQWRQVDEIPELPGGYYTSRNIDNAFRNVVFQLENPRESLYSWNKQINDEIKRKRYEFGVEE